MRDDRELFIPFEPKAYIFTDGVCDLIISGAPWSLAYDAELIAAAPSLLTALLGELEEVTELLCWHAVGDIEAGHYENILWDGHEDVPSGLCGNCSEDWPCPTERAHVLLVDHKCPT